MFRERSKCLGKGVSGSVVMEVDRGFGKKPAFGKENSKQNAVYGEATGDLNKIQCEH